MLALATRMLLLLYAGLSQIALAYLLFVAILPYPALIALPIPILGPLWLSRRVSPRIQGHWYLGVQAIGVSALLMLRLWLDLWLPI